ncbi:RnlB RNA ligase 2 [Enhygromyxa salina]|uniref:RnlB RNA ligase 2 n=1 Tax=Enhygromyxa salina TaxID=215803 RepID=A0A0C2DA41_9BACT|nr:RNA ligase family protein [Enhygromyxa salina]KIG18415.1 RnlB RNA ligase 2 [Enhygromyxa salina]
MQKFTHIEALHQVARYIEITNENPDCPEIHKIRTPVKFRATVKLHGTNAGVNCSPEGLVMQSRSRVITVGDDNAGFAAWMAEPQRVAAVRAIEASVRAAGGLDAATPVTIFGEFVGPGIQKGTAVNALPARQWVVFAARILKDETDHDAGYLDVIGPFENAYADADIHSVFDAPTHELGIDFDSRESKLEAASRAEALTQAVEAQCPWGARFGIQGIGEGLVWTPIGPHWGHTGLYFKTKGEQHKGTKRTKSQGPQIDPEVLAGIEAFIEFAVTDNRLEQGLDTLGEQGHSLEMKNMRFFLQWVGQDVKRECSSDLEASGLEWKTVSRAVTTKAKNFFVKRISL